MEFPIVVAVDEEILMALTKWHLKSIYDRDGIVQTALDNRKLHPTFVKQKMRDLNADVPLILQDRWLGQFKVDWKGDKYYDNLKDITWLYQFVQEGIVKLAIPPRAWFGFNNLGMAMDYYYDAGVKITNYKNQYYAEFVHYKESLIRRYIIQNALKTREGQISSSAHSKTAEISLFGLPMIVKREDIYVHEDTEARDFNYRRKIKEINSNAGLMFETNSAFKSPASPLTINQFVQMIRKYLNGQESKFFYFTEGNYDKDLNFEPRVVPTFPEDIFNV